MNLDLNMQAFSEFQMPKILDIVDESSHYFLLLDADGGLFPRNSQKMFCVRRDAIH